MNTLRDPNDIDDNQFTYLQNFTMEGNKLQTMKGNQRLVDSLFQTARVQGIGSYGNTIFYVDGNALKNFDIVDGVLDKTRTATSIIPT